MTMFRELRNRIREEWRRACGLKSAYRVTARVDDKHVDPGRPSAAGATGSQTDSVLPVPATVSKTAAGVVHQRPSSGPGISGAPALKSTPGMDINTCSLLKEFAGWDTVEPETIEKWVAAGILSPEETRSAEHLLKKLRTRGHLSDFARGKPR